MQDLQNTPKRPNTMGIVFGIIMIVIYFGMGVLMFTSFFENVITIEWIRILLGVMFILYGIWRAYRQIKGIDR